MFCPNCGKEIPENIKFCNYCGTPQSSDFARGEQSEQQNVEIHTAENSRPVYQPSTSPKRKKSKAAKIIISIAVVVVAFIIGYFATGADKLKQPTAFDTPNEFQFDEPQSPSIKKNTDENLSESNPVENSTDGYPGESTDWLVGSSGKSMITFDFRNSKVNLIRGHIYSADIPDGDGFVKAAEETQARLETLTADGLMYLDNSSQIKISKDPKSSGYRIDFIFSCLDDDQNVAEIAATLLDLKIEAGEIDYVTASFNATDRFGFTDGCVRGSGNKRFELKKSNGSYCTVDMYHEEDSIYVSGIRFEIGIDKDSSSYADMTSKYMTLEKAIRESDSSEIITVGERTDYEDGDFFWSYVGFEQLDEGNPEAVAFVEACIGFPVEGGFLLTDECEQFLLDKGFEITEQDERSYMD